jgi:hypothetical protein
MVAKPGAGANRGAAAAVDVGKAERESIPPPRRREKEDTNNSAACVTPMFVHLPCGLLEYVPKWRGLALVAEEHHSFKYGTRLSNAVVNALAEPCLRASINVWRAAIRRNIAHYTSPRSSGLLGGLTPAEDHTNLSNAEDCLDLISLSAPSIY